MRKICEVTLLVLLLWSLGAPIPEAQEYLDPKGIVRTQIMSLVQTRYGKDFRYVGYTIFDSLIYYSKIEKNYMNQDPYGTLRGCVLFSTFKGHRESGPDTFIVGMIKDGKIIWDNSPGSSANLGGRLLYAQDINSSGKVDLIFAEPDIKILRMGKGPLLYYLYVLSWDGKGGKFINAFRRDGKSVMLSDGGCALVPGKQKAVQAITANLPDVYMVPKSYKTKAYPAITYKWNGSEYGLWPDERESGKK